MKVKPDTATFLFRSQSFLKAALVCSAIIVLSYVFSAFWTCDAHTQQEVPMQHDSNSVYPVGKLTTVSKIRAQASDIDRYDTCAKLFGTPFDRNSPKVAQFMLKPPYSRLPRGVLLSPPGSGNTWARLMLEVASGLRTGSVYNDIQLAEMFPGEGIHDTRTWLVKAHHWVRSPSWENSTRIVFIHRHPVESFFSEYRLRVCHTHTCTFTATSYVKQDFQKFIRQRAMNLKDSLRSLYNRLDNVDLRYNLSQSLMLVNYTDMVQQPTVQLRRVLRFMDSEIDDVRVECAVSLSNDPRVHRSKEGLNLRLLLTEVDPEILCYMWKYIGASGASLGYRIEPYMEKYNVQCPDLKELNEFDEEVLSRPGKLRKFHHSFLSEELQS